MVRVRLAVEAECVPEISANKYALNVRFVVIGAEPRPRTCERDVDFELTFCSL
jgi:cell division protein ZapD